jgi:hypothetical protein
MAMQIGPEQEGTFQETTRKKTSSFVFRTWLHLHYKYRKAQDKQATTRRDRNDTKWKKSHPNTDIVSPPSHYIVSFNRLNILLPYYGPQISIQINYESYAIFCGLCPVDFEKSNTIKC